MLMVPAAPAGYLYGAIVDAVHARYLAADGKPLHLTEWGMTPAALGYRLSFLVCALFILSGIAVAVTLLPKRPVREQTLGLPDDLSDD